MYLPQFSVSVLFFHCLIHARASCASCVHLQHMEDNASLFNLFQTYGGQSMPFDIQENCYPANEWFP
uniref:Secreted protein n=1 Tax=Rhizophora mucronata TaxID=61149 RepID=A0A2P2NX35_RHIMU